MYSKLKSLKVLHVFPDGCVCFSYMTNLKTVKKYYFVRKNLMTNLLKKESSITVRSNFFHLKYYNQILKKILNEFSIKCKTY